MWAGWPPAPVELRKRNAPVCELTLNAETLPAPDSLPEYRNLFAASSTMNDGLARRYLLRTWHWW